MTLNAGSATTDAKSVLAWLVLCYRDTQYGPKPAHEELDFFRGKFKQRCELCFTTLKSKRHQKAIRTFATALSAKQKMNSAEVKQITKKLGLLHTTERYLLWRRVYDLSVSYSFFVKQVYRGKGEWQHDIAPESISLLKRVKR